MQLVKVHQPVDSISIVLLVFRRCHPTELVEANIAMTDPVIYVYGGRNVADKGMTYINRLFKLKVKIKKKKNNLCLSTYY